MSAPHLGALRAAPAPRDEAEVLEDMLEIMRSVASIRAPDRALAVRYTETRSLLLSGRLKNFAPPYLMQCTSMFKFQEFMNLFAPDPARRVQFVDQTFDGCRTALGFARRYNVFEDDAG